MNPAATPYDIIGFPMFAWVPGLSIFVFVAVLTAAAAFAIVTLLKPRNRLRAARKAVDAAAEELLQLSAAAADEASIKSAADRAALLVKRVLSLGEPRDYSALGPAEITRVLNESPPRLRSVLEELLRVEMTRFEPHPTLSKDTFLNLRRALLSYFEASLGGAR